MLIIDQFITPEIKNRIKGESWELLKQTLIALMLEQRVAVFENQESASGKWPELKPSTIKQRKGGGAGAKALRDNGILFNSFTNGGGEGVQYRVIKSNGNEVEIITNVEYAKIQNEGGTINHPGTEDGFGNGVLIPAFSIEIPARPFDEFTPENINEISETVTRFLNE